MVSRLTDGYKSLDLGNYWTLGSALSDFGQKCVARKRAEGAAVHADGVSSYEKALLREMLDTMGNRSFSRLYYTTDRRTGRRAFNNKKAEGMRAIIERARTGEFNHVLERYFESRGLQYYRNQSYAVLERLDERVRGDTCGFFARTLGGIRNLFRRERRYAWVGL